MMRFVIFSILLVLVNSSAPIKVKIQYCVSCGYEQAYNQLAEKIRESYPEAQVSGENYVPSEFIGYLAHVIEYGKIALIIAILSGYFANSTNDILRHFDSNKITCCAMVYSIGILLVQFMMSSGAFEVFVNEKLVWSKLKRGDIPAMDTLFELIDGAKK